MTNLQSQNEIAYLFATDILGVQVLLMSKEERPSYLPFEEAQI